MRPESRRRRMGAALGLVFMAGILAGCVDAGEPAASTSSSRPPAPPPEPKEDLGSLTGRVVDPEQRPVAGARVAITDPATEATTDEAGAFTINDLAPGEYTVLVARLGFAETGRKVAVLAGEVAEVTIVLQPLVIDPEGFLDVRTLRTLIEVGYVLVDNRVPVWATYCRQCDHYLQIRLGPEAVLLEVTFTNGVPLPMDQVWFHFKRNWTNATTAQPIEDGSDSGNGYLTDRAGYTMAEQYVKALRTSKVDRLWLHLAGGLYTPSVNKRIDSFVTLAYFQPIPDGYSALPPK